MSTRTARERAPETTSDRDPEQLSSRFDGLGDWRSETASMREMSMITKEPMPDGDVKVIFRLPSGTADHAVVVGDFNGWSQNATVMADTQDGLEATVTLQRDRSYRFQYLLDGVNWVNDWQADGYADNDYGGSDSVLDLRDRPE